MKFIVNAHGVISESLEGPLAAYITSFSESVSDQGYTLDSVKKQTRIIAFFSTGSDCTMFRLNMQPISCDIVPESVVLTRVILQL
jgi:hypothetical protein